MGGLKELYKTEAPTLNDQITTYVKGEPTQRKAPEIRPTQYAKVISTTMVKRAVGKFAAFTKDDDHDKPPKNR